MVVPRQMPGKGLVHPLAPAWVEQWDQMRLVDIEAQAILLFHYWVMRMRLEGGT